MLCSNRWIASAALSAVEISMRVAWRKFRFLRGISGPSCVLSEVMVIEGFGGFL